MEPHGARQHWFLRPLSGPAKGAVTQGWRSLVSVYPACHLCLSSLCRLGVRVRVRCVSACVQLLSWPAVSLSLVSVRLSLSASASWLLHYGLAPRTLCILSHPALYRTSCQHGRTFPDLLHITRRGDDSGGSPRGSRCPRPCPQQDPAGPRPLRFCRRKALASHCPSAWGRVLSRRMLPPPRRACPEPAAAETRGAWGGQRRRVLGGGGAACARAQKSWRSVARRAEEKAVLRGAQLEVGTLSVWRAGGVATLRGGHEASRTAGPGHAVTAAGAC